MEGDGQLVDDLDLVTGDLARLGVEGTEERRCALRVVDPVVPVEGVLDVLRGQVGVVGELEASRSLQVYVRGLSNWHDSASAGSGWLPPGGRESRPQMTL